VETPPRTPARVAPESPAATRDSFPPTRAAALARLASVDAARYARTRNHLRGAVTRLSPYLTHGLLSVPEVVAALPDDAEKLRAELGWREYFALVHRIEGARIFADRFTAQPRRAAGAHPRRLPRALLTGETGITALDRAIADLLTTGYVHNHARMWIAAVACHVAGADWRAGAAWFQYHLLDGDLASNTLSWQWIAGTGSSKPYLADQANLDRFADTHQPGSFLDRPHDDLLRGPIPEVLRDAVDFTLPAQLPDAPLGPLDPKQPLLAYHPWGIDRTWRANEPGERVLFLEPALLERHPLSARRLAWISAAAADVPGLRIAVADARQVLSDRIAAAARNEAAPVRHRAHPAVAHWPGPKDPHPTAFAHGWPRGDAPRSFSAFWAVVGPPRRAPRRT
jgi:deoxyribodipyrimidine photo-lyase